MVLPSVCGAFAGRAGPDSTRTPGRARLGWLVLLFLVPAPLAAAEAPETGPLLTAAAVRRLPSALAAEGRAAEITGVVVILPENTPAVVLLDETDGLFVQTQRVSPTRIRKGDRVTVSGRTAAGDFAPIVVAETVRHHGAANLPEPTRTTLAEIATGGFDAKWVEVEGIVRDALVVPRPQDRSRKITVLVVAWAETRLRVRVQAELNVSELIDARVRVRGVCFNLHNSNRQFVSASLQTMGGDSIRVLAPPPADPFAIPLRRAGELLQFDPAGFTGHRVRVQGVVTHQKVGDALWIRDGSRGLRVVSAQAGPISPGEWVDIVGFVDRSGYAPSLGDAVFRRLKGGEPPEPIWLTEFAEAVRHEANLIRIEAALQEVQIEPAGVRLRLDWNGRQIEGLLDGAKRESLPVDWQPGSRVRVAGIGAVPPQTLPRESGLWSVTSFQLLLRTPEDVEVVQGAPWWNPSRMNQLLAASAALLVLVIIVLGISWRRQVRRRETERKMAEAEFTAILGERNRMARDIHDSLAQGLNAVSMQLELAKNASRHGTEKVLPHVATAHVIVRGCLAEARESIWNMRSHALEKTDLAGALDTVLRQMSAGLTIEAAVSVTGKPRRLAPQRENDLLRIGQEAIANAIKHSGASRLEVRLEFEGDEVRLRVDDNGRGFDPGTDVSGSGHYGLAGIRERVSQMQGRMNLVSGTDGTRLTVVVTSPDGNRHGGGLI
jgi:signal transduction histidine kinase